jgi:hypothetical protein
MPKRHEIGMWFVLLSVLSFQGCEKRPTNVRTVSGAEGRALIQGHKRTDMFIQRVINNRSWPPGATVMTRGWRIEPRVAKLQVGGNIYESDLLAIRLTIEREFKDLCLKDHCLDRVDIFVYYREKGKTWVRTEDFSLSR